MVNLPKFPSAIIQDKDDVKPHAAASPSDSESHWWLFYALKLDVNDITDVLMFDCFLMNTPGSGTEAGSVVAVVNTGIMTEVGERDLPHPDMT